MPYQNINQLPDSVSKSLPKNAQKIYKEAFNSAWDEYKDPSDRKGNSSREQTAHQIAWSAVKDNYHKTDSGNWVKD